MDSFGLEQWLAFIANVHPQEIVLGLEHVQEVYTRLAGKRQPVPVITVAGTNGKGSTVATLERIYLEAGFRVGVFSSPVLLAHNEMVRLQGLSAADELFCAAYRKIEAARGQTQLTSFEFHTLAAFEIFKTQNLDVWLLEVGLGGRLDAVNILDADVGIITSIALDHVAILGDTREKIALEKAGIFRQRQIKLCGDFNPPQTLDVFAEMKKQKRDFGFEENESSWTWWSQQQRLENLPRPALALQNVACALMAVEALDKVLPVSLTALQAALAKVSLPGRLEKRYLPKLHIFDVAHNPAAAEFLAKALRRLKINKIYAVFSMLGDKDIESTLKVMKGLVTQWFVAPLGVARGAGDGELRSTFAGVGIGEVSFYERLDLAYRDAQLRAQAQDCVLVFGSFHTVAQVKTCIDMRPCIEM